MFQVWEGSMDDMAMIGLTLAFFGATWVFVRFCERL
jgi:hypothetical protein